MRGWRAGWHGADIAVPDNITLLPLPPYAPELNPIENVWEYLRQSKLAITVFDGYADIVDKCCEASNFLAEDESRRRFDHLPTMGTGQCLGSVV